LGSIPFVYGGRRGCGDLLTTRAGLGDLNKQAASGEVSPSLIQLLTKYYSQQSQSQVSKFGHLGFMFGSGSFALGSNQSGPKSPKNNNNNNNNNQALTQPAIVKLQIVTTRYSYPILVSVFPLRLWHNTCISRVLRYDKLHSSISLKIHVE
jgi:hypothetical protein